MKHFLIESYASDCEAVGYEIDELWETCVELPPGGKWLTREEVQKLLELQSALSDAQTSMDYRKAA